MSKHHYFYANMQNGDSKEIDNDKSYRQVLRDYARASFGGYDTYIDDVASYVGEQTYDCVQRYASQAGM